MRERLTSAVLGNTVIRMTTISFKVDEHEARAIRLQAKREGVSVSEFLRRRARLALAPPEKPRTVRCHHTGARIFAATEPLPPLTTEMVRDLLSSFP